MKSSFIRKGYTAVSDPGTRPGLHGQTLVSMGLVDLDKLLAGEVFQTRSYADFSLCKQQLKWIMPKPPAGGIAALIPAPSASSTAHEKEAPAASSSNSSAEPELRIAWQYRKYIQQAASSSAAVPAASRQSTAQTRSPSSQSAVQGGVGLHWCHPLDLTKSLTEDALTASGLVASALAGPSCYARIQDEALAFIRQFPGQAAQPTAGLAPRGPESVGRLVIQSVGSPAWGEPLGTSAGAIVRMVLALRQAVQDTRCAVMITCPAGLLPPSHAARLQHLGDTVLALQSVADDSDITRLLPDPASVSALLSVVKLPSAGMLGPRLPEIPIYVVRNKRRRLTIQAIEIDPDAEAAAAAEGGGSVASMLCAGPPQAAKSLDF